MKTRVRPGWGRRGFERSRRARRGARTAERLAGVLALALAAGGARPAHALDPPPEVWTAVERQAAQDLERYLRIDTTNPPGHELKAAQFFAEIFRGLGIEHQVLEIAPGRANVYARLRGTGAKRPLILSNHMDVVGADAAAWKHPPFSGARVEGEIWGRGALDMKGTGIVQLTVLRILHQRKTPLARDVIFLGLADEEDQGLGATWMATQRPELIRDAEFLLNEGGNVALRADGRAGSYQVATLEKALLWLELRVEGRSGHGSVPMPGSAPERLLAALERLRRAEPRVRLLPSVESYLSTVAADDRPQLRAGLKRLKRSLEDRRFRRALLADPTYGPLLYDTVAITGFSAGEKINVIPRTASATLDCRLLPGLSKGEFLARLRAILADDAITIREVESFETLESPPNTELMDVIRAVAARFDPGVPVVALPLTSTTDSSIFRRLGIIAYGFDPFRLSEAEVKLQHGEDERISEANLNFGIRFLSEVVERLAAEPKSE